MEEGIQVDNFFGHDDVANVVAAVSVLSSQISGYRLPAPSDGISTDDISEEQRTKRDMLAGLLDRPARKKKPELDEEALIDEVLQWEEEFEVERAKKDTAKDVRLLSGWRDED